MVKSNLQKIKLSFSFQKTLRCDVFRSCLLHLFSNELIGASLIERGKVNSLADTTHKNYKVFTLEAFWHINFLQNLCKNLYKFSLVGFEKMFIQSSNVHKCWILLIPDGYHNSHQRSFFQYNCMCAGRYLRYPRNTTPIDLFKEINSHQD